MSTATTPDPATTEEATPPALLLEDVTLEVGDGAERVRALDGVSLSVRHGEFVAVIGPSGAGKSSLLAVAGALTAPTSGTVLAMGHDLAEVRRQGQGAMARFRREHIGFVFQAGNLIPALSAADQLRLAYRLGRRRGEKRAFDPLPLLASVGMEHRASHRPGQLSGGERQRVGIARAMIHQPSVILADEPTSALDAARAHEIVRLLRYQAHQRNIAAVMVTHDAGILAEADRVVTIRDGRIIDDQAAPDKG